MTTTPKMDVKTEIEKTRQDIPPRKNLCLATLVCIHENMTRVNACFSMSVLNF